MSNNVKSIPVNQLEDNTDVGISVEKIEYKSDLLLKEAADSHRHNYHIFILMKDGEIDLEVDFEKQLLKTDSLTYIHPSQIHRMADLRQATFFLLGITSENIRDEYFQILEQALLPVKPLSLKGEIKSVVFDSIHLCEKIYGHKEKKLYSTILKDHCNALVGLCVSQFLQDGRSLENPNRYEIITKAFRQSLEQNFTKMKSAADYAKVLNISPSYLRESIRITTGLSVSEQIQNRIILETKRLLYHTDKSVKEIAIELGYEDYSYFSRVFKNKVGYTALEFRNQARNKH